MALMIDDVRYFIKVSEVLNITKASQMIGVSQPTLSYAIKRLEHYLGGELLIRLKNGIQLTKLGEEFKRRAYHLLHEWEQVQNLTLSSSGLSQAKYTIAIHPSVALYTIPSFMPALQYELPSLNVSFIHGLSREMTEKVIHWEADFGIVVNPLQHPDLVISKLFQDEVTIFYGQHAQHKLIYDNNLAQSQHILKKIYNQMTFDGIVHSANLEVVAKLTSLLFGYGILPARVATQYEHLKKLKNAPTFKDEICLIYRPEKHNNSTSKKIIHILKTAFA